MHDRLVKLVKDAMHEMYYLPNFLPGSVLDPDPEYCLNKIIYCPRLMANACRHVRHKFLIHLVKCTTCRFIQNKDYDLPILD